MSVPGRGSRAARSSSPKRWDWGRYLVCRGYGTKHQRAPLVGELALDCDVWDSPGGSGQRLMVLTAEPRLPLPEVLRILTS
ncbi:hypothetical protein ACFQQB_11170 [Nonomuraea rubra]|uniref:MmyB family transcriptional regulator n=1 Tax=Nonomuraea rubra TaxID=46180 RepID=UPI003612AFBB